MKKHLRLKEINDHLTSEFTTEDVDYLIQSKLNSNNWSWTAGFVMVILLYVGSSMYERYKNEAALYKKEVEIKALLEYTIRWRDSLIDEREKPFIETNLKPE